MTSASKKHQWPMRNSDLAQLLGISEITLRRHQRNHKSELIEHEDYRRMDLGVPNAPTLMTVWSEQGAIKIARHCTRSEKAKSFLQEMGVADQTVFFPEGRLLDIIESSMNGFSACFRNYNVRRFRVDLYLKDLNIAIECDEHGHKDRHKWYEELRQEEIEKRLGCRFIGLTHTNPDSISEK